ncbi:alpha-galactosidase [Congregibacter brevis]|uniref:alpha-galactosidase n=1 Tax=Congregibacter brevis TaxID=3081201 RepID=A0ABZ0IA74_9GAMM|nr:alpha-galactosidase [Congregibacter sp. IMCC45268]
MTLSRLDAGASTLVLDCGGNQLSLCYLGSRLPEGLDLDEIPQLTNSPTPHGELDCEVMAEGFPTMDGQSSAHSALMARRNDHALLTKLRVSNSVSTEASLKIELRDEKAAVKLQVEFRSTPSGVFSSRCTVVNTSSDTELHVDWLASLHLQLPASHKHVERYGGFWANELLHERTALGQYAIEIGSTRGRSSHQNFPTLICGESGFSDEQKSVLLATLEWSGNHRLRIDPSPAVGHSLQAGVQLQPGELRLAPGEQWQSPSALFALSNQGVNEIRRQFKQYWLHRKGSDIGAMRPVHFNSWESSYFSHDANSSLELIDAAHALGAERFVLDDGWMQGRTDIGRGLGDWVPCAERYPAGLGPLATHARSLGLSFGVWIEPEMVTSDTQVAREHPDWIISSEGYAPVSGRQQFLLNLCIPSVHEHILQCIDRLVKDCNPDYLKWDMNRDYAQVGFGETATPYEMTQAWYTLVSKVRARHPNIAIESCAAGGARTDAGALAQCDRVWPSDSMDPLQRFLIMKHANTVFPPQLLGTHVGASPSSTSGAQLPLSTRCIIALLGHMGLELNPKELSDNERSTLRRWTAFYQAERKSLANADFYYLDQIEPGLDLLLVYNKDNSRGLLFVLRSAYPRQAQPPTVRLPSCVANTYFDMELLNPEDADFVQLSSGWHRGDKVSVSGDTLHQVGLKTPFLRFGHCALIQLTPNQN